jgi:hypothetical protein
LNALIGVSSGPLDREAQSCVLEHGGDGTVVFGRCDEKSIVFPHQLLEANHARRKTLLGFYVLIGQRERKVAEIEFGDLGSRAECALGGDIDQFFVKRILPGAAREGENLGAGGHLVSPVEMGIVTINRNYTATLSIHNTATYF